MNENTEKNKAEEVNTEKSSAAMISRKREIIKTILIIFLAVLLVLTFFSNTIMNKSLAEISTECASSGKLTERIRGSGMAESNQSYEVKTDGSKIIDKICIKTGQEIEKGTVLFTIGTGESPELTEAENALSALELDYQKSLLVLPADYSSENQAIKNAQADLNAAIAKRNSAVENQGSAQAALERYNQNKAVLQQKTDEQAKLQSTVAAIDTDDYAGAAVEYTGNLPVLYSSVVSAEADYNAAFQLYSQLVSEGRDASAAKADADSKAAQRDSVKGAYEAEKSTIRDSLVNQMMNVNQEINSISAEITAYESSQAGGGAAMTIDELNADIDAKQRALEELVIALEKTKKENNITSQISNLDVEAKKAEVEKQKAVVEKLKKECETTEIKSEYSGIVASVNIKPGDTTVPEEPLAVIDISSEGYRVQITVDGEKAKKVKVGTEAEVVNNWGGEVKAVLAEIKNDTISGSKNRILVFDVTGDVDSGTNIDLSIPCGSGNYDVIVPKSAVYEDKNGKFVLTVRSKSSPLGNRYFAERVNVEVLASDETSSAVSGDISMSDYVITAASAPVKPNDQVRMKD